MLNCYSTPLLAMTEQVIFLCESRSKLSYFFLWQICACYGLMYKIKMNMELYITDWRLGAAEDESNLDWKYGI